MATSRVKPQEEAAADQRGDDHVARMRRLACELAPPWPRRLPMLSYTPSTQESRFSSAKRTCSCAQN